VENAKDSRDIPTGKVMSLCAVEVTISGHKKEFHWPMKVSIASVAKAGFIKGKMIHV
jgi:hypothetical protein